MTKRVSLKLNKNYYPYRHTQIRKTMSIILLFFPIILFYAYVFAQQPVKPYDIGIDEKLGKDVPLDLSFYEENGNYVSLKQLIHNPTIVSLVYYRCANICNPLLSGLAQVLTKLPLKPDKDYSILTISFDDKDTPAIAFQKKKNYLKAIKKPFPEKTWKFLTGDSLNINQFANAVGFKFKKEGNDFLHPASLIVLSGDGKIIRYLYGITFLPFDLKMALTEASEGRIGPTISKVLLYCFNYDPKGKKYVFNITRVAGSVVLLFVIAFFVYLAIKGKVNN
jgi:protein SCO1/2